MGRWGGEKAGKESWVSGTSPAQSHGFGQEAAVGSAVQMRAPVDSGRSGGKEITLLLLNP